MSESNTKGSAVAINEKVQPHLSNPSVINANVVSPSQPTTSGSETSENQISPVPVGVKPSSLPERSIKPSKSFHDFNISKNKNDSFTVKLLKTNSFSNAPRTQKVEKKKIKSVIDLARKSSSSKISFKLLSQDDAIKNSAVPLQKDLPLTELFQSTVVGVDINELKTGVIAMSKNAFEQASQKTNNGNIFYDFLISHSLKLLQFLSKAKVEVQDAILEWKALVSTGDKTDLPLALNLWAHVQQIYFDFVEAREEQQSMIIEEFQGLEERNLLLQDFVHQTKRYSIKPEVEISVKQVVKTVSQPLIEIKETDSILEEENINSINPNSFVSASSPLLADKEESKIVSDSVPIDSTPKKQEIISEESEAAPNSFSIASEEIPKMVEKPSGFSARPRINRTRVSFIKKNFVNVKIQTDSVHIGDRHVDVLDRATGPDREIPVYRAVACTADFRHPVEDLYDQIKIDYRFLEQKTADLQVKVVETFEVMKTDLETKLKVQDNNAKEEISKLESSLSHLKLENQRLEQELMASNNDNASRQVELENVQEKILILKQKLEEVTISEEEEREFRQKAEQKLMEAKKEVKNVTEALERKTMENSVLQEEKKELIIQSDVAAKKAQEISQILQETNVLYEIAKKAESELALVSEELKKEQEFKVQLTDLNETLKAENDCVHDIEERLNNKNSDLEAIIAKLMEFPDLSLGNEFKIKESPEMTNEFGKTLQHMIEHNNLRISLLEQRNGRFREMLSEQSIVMGSDQYSKYHPISTTSLIFNMNAIELKSRPNTADSNKSISSDMTYILGRNQTSRPVSAVSVRLLRPASGRNLIDKAAERPIFTKLSQSQSNLEIEEGPNTKYPPTRFPFLSPHNPLAVYDSALLEDSKPLGVKMRPVSSAKSSSSLQALNAATAPRSCLKGSRPSTAKTRPTSAVTFKWSDDVRKIPERI